MNSASKINAIIIEDNKESQEYLANLLNFNFDQIVISGYADSVNKSIKLIDRKKPELIFMDIELIDGNSFEIIDNIQHNDFEVIFVTAFDNFLQKAIDHYAFSYIVKPIDENKLINIVTRYINLKDRFFTKNKYQSISSFFKFEQCKILTTCW